MRVRQRRSVPDVAIMTIGIVIGAGIFRVPSAVAGAVGPGGAALALAIWIAGAVAAFAGALCHAALRLITPP